GRGKEGLGGGDGVAIRPGGGGQVSRRRRGHAGHDGEVDGGERTVHCPVEVLVGERVAADVSGVRLIGERAVGVQVQQAVRWAGDQPGGELVPVGAVVIEQHVSERAHARGDGERVVRGRWCLVGDVERYGHRGSRRYAVVGRVGEGVLASEL